MQMLPRTHAVFFRHEVLISTGTSSLKLFTEAAYFSRTLAFEVLIYSGNRIVCSHQIRLGLPLLSSDKNKGDAGKIASSFAQYIFRNQNVYSSTELFKWESYKSNAVSERCFAKKMFCKIMSCTIAVVEMLKRYLLKKKIKFWLIGLWNRYCWPYTTNFFSSVYKWCEPATINTRNFFAMLISLSSTSTYLILLHSKN